MPRDALPDGSPIREKLANLRKPKKYKTSENDYSHGSFFLRVGGIGKKKIIKFESHTTKSSSFSVRSWNDDLQWDGTWRIFRGPMELSLLPGPEGHQPDPPDDLYLQPDVLCFHECESKFGGKSSSFPRSLDMGGSFTSNTINPAVRE